MQIQLLNNLIQQVYECQRIGGKNIIIDFNDINLYVITCPSVL